MSDRFRSYSLRLLQNRKLYCIVCILRAKLKLICNLAVNCAYSQIKGSDLIFQYQFGCDKPLHCQLRRGLFIERGQYAIDIEQKSNLWTICTIPIRMSIYSLLPNMRIYYVESDLHIVHCLHNACR